MDDKSKDRPEDQPMPTPNQGVDMYTLVCADLRRAHSSNAVAWRVIEGLEKRRALGISRYGVALQAFNGRDGGQDLLEELQDASVYAMQCIQECRPYLTKGRYELTRLVVIYDKVLDALLELTAIRAEQASQHE
jgi:hypothetical protein